MFPKLWPDGRHYKEDEASLARAVTALAEDCGLDHVITREWPQHVRAVQPETGEKLDEREAVLAEIAPGASVEMLTLRLQPSARAAARRGCVCGLRTRVCSAHAWR